MLCFAQIEQNPFIFCLCHSSPQFRLGFFIVWKLCHEMTGRQEQTCREAFFSCTNTPRSFMGCIKSSCCLGSVCFSLGQQFSTWGPQIMSKGSSRDDYDQSKASECPLLQFKGVHTASWTFQRGPHIHTHFFRRLQLRKRLKNTALDEPAVAWPSVLLL